MLRVVLFCKIYFGDRGTYVLKNSTYIVDEIYSLFIVDKDVKIKYKIYISTINKP